MYYTYKEIKVKEETIIKFLNGECSSEEALEIRKWMENPTAKKHFDEILQERWRKMDPELSGNVCQGLPEEILKKIGKSKDYKLPSSEKQQSRIRQFDFAFYSKIAATLLIFCSVAWFLLVNLNKEAVKEEVVIVPEIHKVASIGHKLTFKLPDGSKVILNSGSSISYPVTFSNEVRVVKLEGEAFFEVTSDLYKPFKVVTPASVTTVLGTHFNVNDRMGTTRITLTEGKVQVESKDEEDRKDVVLSPGEMAISTLENRNLSVQKVDIDEVTAWKKGIINFNNSSLKEAFTKLENWYGVDIVYPENINFKRKIKGKFENENLENILTGLAFSLEFEFEIIENRVMIKKKK